MRRHGWDGIDGIRDTPRRREMNMKSDEVQENKRNGKKKTEPGARTAGFFCFVFKTAAI